MAGEDRGRRRGDSADLRGVGTSARGARENSLRKRRERIARRLVTARETQRLGTPAWTAMKPRAANRLSCTKTHRASGVDDPVKYIKTRGKISSNYWYEYGVVTLLFTRVFWPRVELVIC